MATASVTLSLNQSAFLAGMARARASVSGLGSSIASIGARGIVAAGAAIGGLAVAAAVGIKKAFDFGGKLADLSAISGRSTREILLLRRALQDAGISMEKIDRYILTGADRGQVIARALENMSSGDWKDAADSVGKQADILEENAKTFDRVSDLLGRSGDKLRGFFVGAAGAIGKSLLPILEKFDKMDFASQGQKFGDGLLKGAQALAGFFQNPETLFKAFEDGFTAVILGIGNVMIAVFKKALSVLQAGAQAAFEVILNPDSGKGMLNAIDSGLIKILGKDMSGKENTKLVNFLQNQINKRNEGTGKPVSFADRMLEIANETPLDVKDIFHAGGAIANAQAGISGAAGVGQSILPTPQGATGFGQSAAERAMAGQKRLEESQRAAADAISRITIAGTSGIDSSLFGKNAMASENEFASRWGMPKPSGAGQDKNTDKELLKESQTTNEILRAGLITDQ